MSNKARLAVALAAFVVSAAFLVVAILYSLPERGLVSTQPSSVGGAFQMVNQDGRAVTEADYKGKPHLVFFGFTHCPDICPTALFEISEVLRRLGPDAEKAGAVFVSVDPERDTPEKLKLYLSSFHPRISALTGTTAQVEAMTRSYRVFAKKVPLDGGGYTMDHSAIVYLMDKNGHFVAPFNLKRTPDAAAADLKRYL
jgi:protein SCO1/2